ncbi:hypothetical protein JCM19241_349 [Vibrio ishigakensis]|uniref:Uncharacterized protein n=1 Tax=Vibrio ishigakensis TaxID=1481914 RepID=A0A0B8QBK8_9VIBR|nr:hypothetical protein JCM19241_349 [Vibrio ishigakensis]
MNGQLKENPDFIFDTLNLKDKRLNPKLETFGVHYGNWTQFLPNILF